MQITVDFKPDVDKIGKMLESVDLVNALRDKVVQISRDIQDAAQSQTPIRTGKLRSSIFVVNSSPLGAIIKTDLNYALFVHEGTKNMRGRPFMELGAGKVEKSIDQQIADGVTKELESKIK